MASLVVLLLILHRLIGSRLLAFAAATLLILESIMVLVAATHDSWIPTFAAALASLLLLRGEEPWRSG